MADWRNQKAALLHSSGAIQVNLRHRERIIGRLSALLAIHSVNFLKEINVIVLTHEEKLACCFCLQIFVYAQIVPLDLTCLKATVQLPAGPRNVLEMGWASAGVVYVVVSVR